MQKQDWAHLAFVNGGNGARIVDNAPLGHWILHWSRNIQVTGVFMRVSSQGRVSWLIVNINCCLVDLKCCCLGWEQLEIGGSNSKLDINLYGKNKGKVIWNSWLSKMININQIVLVLKENKTVLKIRFYTVYARLYISLDKLRTSWSRNIYYRNWSKLEKYQLKIY